MLMLAMLLLIGSATACAASLGLITLNDKVVRTRLLAEGATPLAEGAKRRRMRQIDAPEGTARRLVSRGMLSRIERNLVFAGHPDGWSIKNIMLAKVLIPVAVFALLSKISFIDSSPPLFVMGVVALVIAYFVPDLLIYSRATERQEEMQRQLPDLLDMLVITIEAGMGFESALARTAMSGTGPLADEFARTIQDIRLGMSRRDAYEAFQRRTKSDDIHGFIRGIMQAEEHGSSISGMVRIQSAEMRTRRKLRAEAKAGQVAVKLLAPLMLCIFPVLFIVVLAPGIMTAFHLL